MTLAASLEPEAKTEKARDVYKVSTCGAHVVSSIFAEVSVRYKCHPFFRATSGASLLVYLTNCIFSFHFISCLCGATPNHASCLVLTSHCKLWLQQRNGNGQRYGNEHSVWSCRFSAVSALHKHVYVNRSNTDTGARGVLASYKLLYQLGKFMYQLV